MMTDISDDDDKDISVNNGTDIFDDDNRDIPYADNKDIYDDEQQFFLRSVYESVGATLIVCMFAVGDRSSSGLSTICFWDTIL